MPKNPEPCRSPKSCPGQDKTPSYNSVLASVSLPVTAPSSSVQSSDSMVATKTNSTSGVSILKNTGDSHKNALGVLGGGLGVALGALILVATGLLFGLIYYYKKANYHR